MKTLFYKFKKVTAHVAALAVTLLPVVATAQKFTNPIKSQSLNSLLVDILDVVVLLGSIVVVIYIILAGFKYVTAQGDEGQIGDAHKALTYAVIGAAVILGAKVIASAINATVNELGI